MQEDRLLTQLKEDLADDFVPVKPLKESWRRALWLFPLSLILVEITLATFHLRPDHDTLGPLALWGFSFLQFLAAYIVFAVCLRACMPGSSEDSFFLTGVGLAGLALHWILSWLTLRISPNWPSNQQEWHLGLACLLGIGLLGIPALALGYFLVRAGLPIRSRFAGLLLGLGGGLAAEASWRLHCPFSSWNHILFFHSGSIVIIVGAGMLLGWLWKRSVSRSRK